MRDQVETSFFVPICTFLGKSKYFYLLKTTFRSFLAIYVQFVSIEITTLVKMSCFAFEDRLGGGGGVLPPV
jgi:hypothetical protein